MSRQPISPARRRFLGQAAVGAGALALGGVAPEFFIRSTRANTVETTRAKLGFIALTDAAPLFVALEKGYFARHGMKNVEVLKQSSWGTTRDNLVLGSGRGGIDGAHILTPMPYLISTGAVTQGNQPVPMRIVMRLNTNGQGISVAKEYAELDVGLDSGKMKDALLAKRVAGSDGRAAMTFPGGTHDLWLRYWLAAGGIDPNRDVSTIVVPPPQMVANMRVGSMDAFCVGEPWNAQLINQDIGYSALTTGDLWNDHPEKALGLRADYVETHPRATQALIMAVMEAQMFCEAPENKAEVAEICSRRRWIHAPASDIVDRLQGRFDFGRGRVVEGHPYPMKFWADQASYPFKSHDLWFLTENQRWGYLPADLDTKTLIDEVNREDLWREAAAALGVDAAEIPASTSRGVETFFDGTVFDPENPQAYLDSLAIQARNA